MEDAEVVLRRAPLFEGLDEESARALRRQMLDVKLSRGEHLFLEGQDGDRLYVVMDGKLKLTRAAADGRENLLSVVGPGEMFGELSLFDPRPRTSSASAVTDATLAALAHDTLRSWLLERPDVSMHMLQALARRLRRANDVVADLVFTDPPYNVPISGHAGGSGAIKHREFVMASGEMTASEFTSFRERSFKNLAAHSVDGSIHFVCMDWRAMSKS